MISLTVDVKDIEKGIRRISLEYPRKNLRMREVIYFRKSKQICYYSCKILGTLKDAIKVNISESDKRSNYITLKFMCCSLHKKLGIRGLVFMSC